MTDEDYMRLALELAGEAAREGEVPVGAVIVRNGEVIAVGRNRRETGAAPSRTPSWKRSPPPAPGWGAGGFSGAICM